MVKALSTVVETAPFLADAASVLTDDERAEVVLTIARDPEAGDVMRGTGGLRKIRVHLGNRGKSAGARVIYYFLNAGHPVYLLGIFAKNDKANLNAAERNDLAKLVALLKASLLR